MNTPTLRALMPAEMIGPLGDLGRGEWLVLEPGHATDARGIAFSMALPLEERPMPHGRLFQALSELARDGKHDEICHFYALSKLLAHGPKLLRPTAEQCEALEHVDVAVAIEDYEQPFPAFLVDLPDQYRRALTQRHGFEAPRLILVFHHREARWLFVCPERGLAKNATFCSVSSSRRFRTIDEVLRHCDDDSPDYRVDGAAMRVAVNFGLLLARFGAKDCGPLDPAAYQRQLRNVTRRNARKADRARRLLDATINRIEFAQQVVFYERVGSGGPSHGGGPPRSPHWRRGHFRKVPCGVGRRGRRLTFIRPTLVNAERFHGDAADTSYSIQSAVPPDTRPPTGRSPAKPR